MQDTMDGVVVFVEAVEAGGFSRAAERMALSRSAIGKTIARLEARLGARLFHRTTRVQTLTEEGHAYYERCRRALEELRAGESLLEAGRSGVVGSLRVSMPIMFGRYCVAPILIEMAREHPTLELDLRFSDLAVDLLGEGFDLAIRNGPTADGGGLRTRKLLSQRKIICAAPSYLEERGRPDDIAELALHDALVYSRNDRLSPWRLNDANGELQEFALNCRIRLDSMEAIVDAAVAGMGIAWVPDWLVRDHLREGRLCTLLDHRPSTLLDTYAVWPDTPHLPKRLRLAIDTLASKLPGATQI